MFLLLRIEGCKNIAKVIMAGCSMQKWPEPTQKGELLLAEPRYIYNRFRTRQNRQQTQQ